MKINKFIYAALALIGLALCYTFPAIGIAVGTSAALYVGTRWSRPNDANRFDTLAIQSLPVLIPYTAAVEIPAPVRGAFRHYIEVAQLTGALTFNGTNIITGSYFTEGDEVVFTFTCDATSRTITWGTNIRAAVAATLVLPISGVGVARAMFLGGKLHIYAQSAL